MLYLIFSLLLFPCADCVVEDLFGFNVDELFSTMIGPVYKVRRTGHTTPANPSVDNNATTTTHPGVTAHSIYPNETEEPSLKKKLDLESILKDDISGKPNFEVDEIEGLSRRFDAVLEGAKNKPGKPILRESYFVIDDVPMIRRAKYMCLILMEHFLYQTRYKMPYAQKMRAEYIPRIRYKIGYAISLLRILKNKQYVLYSVMTRNRYVFDHLSDYIKIFEKVIRLDLEIKDLMMYIKSLERQRVVEFAEARKKVNEVRDVDGGENRRKN